MYIILVTRNSCLNAGNKIPLLGMIERYYFCIHKFEPTEKKKNRREEDKLKMEKAS